MKKLGQAWLIQGAYGYIVGPAIDKIIPETDNRFLNGAKEFNRVNTLINQLCFITPIAVVDVCATEVINKLKNFEFSKVKG